MINNLSDTTIPIGEMVTLVIIVHTGQQSLGLASPFENIP